MRFCDTVGIFCNWRLARGLGSAGSSLLTITHSDELAMAQVLILGV